MNLQNNNLKGQHVAQRFVNSARQMNLTKNKDWLERLILKNKVFYRNPSGRRQGFETTLERTTFIARLSELIDVFERKFDNNWDIHLDYQSIAGKFELSFLINYENVTITNSSNQSRELTNLLVVLPIAYKDDTKNVYVRQIKGARLTLEEDEWASGYMHSHLPSITKIADACDVFSVDDFCIGSEDLSELEIELSVDFDAEKFEMMLYTIDSLVSWESLEGGPFKRMSQITSENTETRINHNNDSLRSLYSNFKSYYLDNQTELPLDFVFVNNRYQIKHNEKFVNYIKDAFLDDNNLKTINHLVLCKRGTDGYFYDFSEAIDTVNPSFALQNIKSQKEGQIPFIYIQGKKIEFNINFSEKTNQMDITEYTVHPKFLQYVSEQLESQIYKACVRGSSINKLSNTSGDVRRYSEQNQIPL